MNRARHDSSSDKERRELYFRANVLQRTFVDIRRGERIKKKKKKKEKEKKPSKKKKTKKDLDKIVLQSNTEGKENKKGWKKAGMRLKRI